MKSNLARDDTATTQTGLQERIIAGTHYRILVRKKRLKQYTWLSFKLEKEQTLLAAAGCKASQGITLHAYLSDMIATAIDTFAQIPGEPEPIDERKLDSTLAPFLEQDRDFAELVVPYVAELPPGCDVTIPELFDVMEMPSASRNRRGEMTLGRILRRLKFTKRRELRLKKVVSLYRKPWG